MANVSFSKNPAAPEQPVIEVQTVPTPVEGVKVDCVNTSAGRVDSPAPTATALVRQDPSLPAPTGLVLGDKLPEFKDIILPRLNIVQGSGELKNSFPMGAIVFNQAVILYDPPVINAKTSIQEKTGLPPFTLTVLGFRPTRYVEKIEGGERGLLLDTEQQVRAAGGTLDYKEWILKKNDGMKRFEYLADAVVVIERPDHVADDDTVFVYPVEGKKLALALWSMKGTAYTAAAKRVFFTARSMGCLRNGYPTYNFFVSTRKETGHGNTWFVPVCLPKAKTSLEFLAFAAGILNAPAESE